MVTLAGTGVAFPPEYAQDFLWREVFRTHFEQGRGGGSRIAARLFSTAGPERRHSATAPYELADTADLSTRERMRRYAERAPALGLRAVRAALADAGTAPEEIGLLTVATCTGYGTPGVDIDLAEALPLGPGARRLLLGHMGCHAAIPGLGAAADYVAAYGRPAVLLCLELTSLHVQPATTDIDQAVVHALFSDAAAAVVLRPDGTGGPAGTESGTAAAQGTGGPAAAESNAAVEHRAGAEAESGARAGARRTGPPRVVDIASRTDTARRGHMTWQVTDLGFRMGLSPEVPDALAEHVGPLVKDLLARHGLDPSDVRSWAVHPGGPRVLDAVRDGLDLGPSALDASRRVLRDHGNCSSATVLLVLDEILRADPAPGPTVMLAFGPGLTLYAALLDPA